MWNSSSFRMETTSTLRIRPMGESREMTSSEDTPKTSKGDPIDNDSLFTDYIGGLTT